MQTELCPACAKKQAHPEERRVLYLLRKLQMQDNSCPLGRHELKNHEWIWLGVLKDERAKVWQEEHPMPMPRAGA